MKIEAQTVEGDETGIVLSEVYSGVGIKTEMGLFGIAQRDDGIEVMLNGKTVWTSHEISGGSEHLVLGNIDEDILASNIPDLVLGSPELSAASPRNKHWFYAKGPNNPPAPMLGFADFRQDELDHIRAATRFAVRASTAQGVVDPDAMVKNVVIGMLGLPVPNKNGTFSNPFELGRPSPHGRLNDSDLVSSDGPGYSPYRTDCPVCAAPVGETCKNGLESLSSSVHMGRVRAVNRGTP